MTMITTVTKPKIAFIDDEDRILRSLKMHFRATHDVFTTTEPDELLSYVHTVSYTHLRAHET